MAIHPKAEETIIRIEEKKYKQFDVISGDHCCHTSLSSAGASDTNKSQLSSETKSSIMKEWKILEEGLPDSIFVRTHEGEIDLLRALIIGPSGTPYHKGLFFYDIKITSGYPYTRPKIVPVLPSNIRRNPKLDPNNLVCHRAKPNSHAGPEKKKYSILEILLSVQANLTHSKPEPALDQSSDLPSYCKYLLDKDYSTFILNCRLILEEGLPDSIFVRTHEGEIDLLRALIIGPSGTPYHKGLFFYDIKITSGYPYTRPKIVPVLPSNIRRNPKLDPNNLVCHRAKPNSHAGPEKKKYSILEILLSVQANLTHSKPEPALDQSSDLPSYCKYLLDKDYSTFILNCRLMLASLKKPPEHFEEIVAEHFRNHAVSIVTAFKSYIDDGESKVAEDVNNDIQCGAIKEEYKRYRKILSYIYAKLIVTFASNGYLKNYIGNTCSTMLLSSSVVSLIFCFFNLVMGCIPTASHEDIRLMLKIGLVLSFCFGLAFVLVKLTGCDFSLDDMDGVTGYDEAQRS